MVYMLRHHCLTRQFTLTAPNLKCGPNLTFALAKFSRFHPHIVRFPHSHAFQSSLIPLARPRIDSKSGYTRALNTGLQSHVASFSRFPPLQLRKTYFPKNSPGGSGSPPKEGLLSRLKKSLNALPSTIVLWTVLGLNGVVYVAWNIGIDRVQNHRDPSIITALYKNFTLSWQNWKEGRFWTVLTSCFSNQATSHILMNALTFYWMAPPVLQILGNASFLILYLGGGVASSLITLYCNEMILKQPRVVHGASGAIYAVISFMACVAPKATFLIFGIIPLPAWGCVAGLFTWDLLNAVSQRQTGVSEISHLSGIMSGIVYFLHKTGRIPKFF